MDKTKVNLSVWYEIFDPETHDYIADCPTFEQAKEIAGDKYCVDLIIELNTDNGSNLIESDDRLYTVQVYPEYKQYRTHDLQPVLLTGLVHNAKMEQAKDILDYLLHHNKNYTKTQLSKLDELNNIIQGE